MKIRTTFRRNLYLRIVNSIRKISVDLLAVKLRCLTKLGFFKHYADHISIHTFA